jgi:hypothetical protein
MPAWRQLPPESLILDPTLLSAIPDELRADKASQYAHSADTGSYDDLGFCIYAASGALRICMSRRPAQGGLVRPRWCGSSGR